MTDQPENRLVWTEIPATDLARARGFYETLLEAPLTEQTDGPQPILVLPYAGGAGASGHVYEGKPATGGDGVTVHLAVDGELSAAKDRVEKAGGEVVSNDIAIPSGSFFYASRPSPNSRHCYGGWLPGPSTPYATR